MNDWCGRVLLQRGRGAGSSAIEFLTHSPVSHALLLYPDRETIIESIQFKGVQKREITADEWIKTEVYIVRGMTATQWHRLLVTAEKEIGYPYDWISLACWLARKDRTVASPTAWFCSELVDYFVSTLGENPAAGIQLVARTPSCQVTPADLRKSVSLYEDKHFWD